MPILPNTGIKIPDPGVTVNWGSNALYGASDAGLNYSFTQIDNIFTADGSGTSIGLNVGSGKTLSVAGTIKMTGTALLGVDGTSGTVSGNTIRAGNASGSDTAGGTFTIAGGNSTGTGVGGSVLLQTAAASASSGSTANTLRTVLRVDSTGRVGVNTGATAAAVTLDVGAGGSGTSNSQQNIRLNGSDAGAGTNGGSLLTIANNGTATGAVGNYSAVMGGSTAYEADTTLASSSTLRFFTGATITGAVASNERLRIGTSGQIGIWDATLVTPAINYGTSGQALRSNGSGSAASWSDTTKILIDPGTSVGTGVTYTINSTIISAAYKVLELNLSSLSHNDSGSNRSVGIEISGNNGDTWTTLSQVTPSDGSGNNFTGVVKITNAAVSSGTRSIIGNVGYNNSTSNQFTSGSNPSVATGYINAIRLTVSGSKNFDGGTVSLVGYN